MIHGCVEDAAGGRIAGLDVHLSQFLVPGSICISYYLTEIPARNLFLQVQLGILCTYSGHTGLHQQWLGGISSGNQPSAGAQWLHGNRLGEFCEEECLLVVRPSLGETVTSHGGSCSIIYIHVLGSIPADTLLQVEYQLCLLCISTEGIALETGTLGSGQLYPYIRLLQFDSIISRAHVLVVVTELDLFLVAICYRQESHVTQVADTGTAQVLVSETDEDGVRMVIARTPVPSAGWFCRT